MCDVVYDAPNMARMSLIASLVLMVGDGPLSVPGVVGVAAMDAVLTAVLFTITGVAPHAVVMEPMLVDVLLVRTGVAWCDAIMTGGADGALNTGSSTRARFTSYSNAGAAGIEWCVTSIATIPMRAGAERRSLCCMRISSKLNSTGPPNSGAGSYPSRPPSTCTTSHMPSHEW